MIALNRCMSVLYAIGFLKNMLFILPVLMLYYGYKGVTIGDFFLIQGLSQIVVFAFEIPTGYIADVFSRKKTIIAGFLIWIVGYLFWMLGNGFSYMLTGELFFGFSISLLSGTTEAYLYDLLKKRNKQGSFHKKMGKYSMMQDIGLLVATISGAVIYKVYGGDFTVCLCIATMVIAVILMCFMPDVEEAKRVVSNGKSKMKDILEISVKTIKNFEIRWLMIFSSIYGTLTLVLMWGLQAVMINRDVPVYLFGVILAINAFARAMWGGASGKLFDKLGLNKILNVLIVIVSVSIFSAISSIYVPYALVYVGLGLMIMGSGSVVPARIVSTTLINHQTKSDERATVLSVKSMVEKFGSAFGMIALKPLFDNLGVGETFMITSVLIIPIILSANILKKFNCDK